jgi:hypothetical protein
VLALAAATAAGEWLLIIGATAHMSRSAVLSAALKQRYGSVVDL